MKSVLVEIRLWHGSALAEIHVASAPQSAEAFLRLVDTNCYDESHVYRRVRSGEGPPGVPDIDVVQFGLAWKHRDSEAQIPTIPHEHTTLTGLRHVRGTLSFARTEPGTATSEVFVVVSDSPELDYSGQRQADGLGFAAFGTIISGMEVFDSLHREQVNEYFKTPVLIERIRRVSGQ